MNLTPREKDKLLIAMAAIVARKRLERGVKLNYPEAVALISDYVVEGVGRFQVGDEWASAGPGEVVWAPAGVVHGVTNEGDGRLTLLIGIAPAP